MNKIKKFICIALALAVIMASSSVNVLAEETETTKRQSDDIERVLEEYYSGVSNIESTENNYVRKMATRENLQYSAVQELNQLGYEAYVVNSDSYNDVERALGTDLESLGVNSEGSYIVVVHGDENDNTISPRSTIGSSFTYNYNGSSYVLRYVTVSSNDNSMMVKANSENVLNSKSKEIIKNFLDASLGVIISSYSEILGFVGDVLGLSISNFGTSSNSSIYLHGSTIWTRQYTQVYSTYSGSWLNGSYTEYARCAQFLGGYYINQNGASIQVDTSELVTNKYSSRYFDAAWKKENAVIGFLNSYTISDRTGTISYTYNGNVLFSHAENF